jgi:hypothetical protein
VNSAAELQKYGVQSAFFGTPVKCNTSFGNQLQLIQGKKSEENKVKDEADATAMATDDNGEVKGEKRVNEEGIEESSEAKKQNIE